ncbi:glycoside hydrolase family 127 protein [Aeoliella sp. ICT_H6.2]|uniref:Glycoside hydrolase family 127 protein n=1 Tax=Aeoliella straminimaris TaxID=2954799 RepID=A0A9X2FFC0_9BACT|nr:beta-L-arabinofuranosidase domain-containing protein [Aeoliella straminimaris]MCO6043036.1 glycoside hydrolase family 127 protein [Aeoliella straminimaris]
MAVYWVALLTPIISCVSARGEADPAAANQAIRMVPFHQVDMMDQIWAPRTRQLVERTLPHAFSNTEGALESLRLCANYLEHGSQGPTPPPHRFRTSDLYKVMEGAALMIQAEPNPGVEAIMDRIIDIIARAQQDDGYLYVAHITHSINEGEMGPRPYSYVIHSHELYNMGHLYEAAVAYAQATGKTKLLDVAEKNAQHVERVFFEGDPNYNAGKPVNQAPGHEEIELGLVKLYLYTGKKQYLEMAKRFLDIRGRSFVPDGQGVNSPQYAQQHLPVDQQTEAVGHAVRACYLYAAMAEVDSLMGTDDYGPALDSIWHSIIDTKMHLSGGLGAVPHIEGFGPEYQLPNMETYLETCAAVGNVLFNLRMFLKHGDAQYVDVAEVALYNNCLAGIGIDGTSFFYPNPLEAEAGHAPRSGWFGTACCPSNLARLIPQVAGYMYATNHHRVYCLLYGSNQGDLSLGDRKIQLTQQTRYPYDGEIAIKVSPDEPAEFELALRIPTWAGEKFVPGELYHYLAPSGAWQIQVNGKPVRVDMVRGFAVIKRTWQPGDKVLLKLPMPVHANLCTPQVEANHDRIAVSRGPLLYSAEQIDNGGAVQRLYFERTPTPEELQEARVETINRGPLAGLTDIVLPVREKRIDGAQDTQLTLIPYFAWSNRDRGSMITWIPTTEGLAKVDESAPENLKFAGASASHTWDMDAVDAVRMKHTPKSSSDTSIRRWTSWQQLGETQWVEIDLGKKQTLNSLGVYFYDDGGGVQLPGSWYLAVPRGSRWQKVKIYNTDEYSSLPDLYNTVHPAKQLKTRRVRIFMTPRNRETTVGILSVNIETKEVD